MSTTDHAARDLAVEQEVEAELVRQLVRQAPTGFALGTLIVAAILLVLWNAAPRGALLLWFLSITILSLPAFIVVWRFTRAPQPAERMNSWRQALTVAYGLAGIGWGTSAVLLYPSVATPYRFFLVFVTAGVGVRGMAALAPVWTACVAYLSGTMLPMSGELLAEGSLPSVVIGLMMLLLWGSIVALASEVRALLVSSVTLGLHNLGLIDDLSKAKDEAEAASRAKSVFLANVSHELRTPLSLILGPIRRLLGASPGGEAHHDLETVERNAQALLKHVTDLLDVAKLEAGRMELHRSQLDVVELVRRTASLFEVVARERNVELTVEAPPSSSMVADAEKLERVLLNLLSNAMKFAPDGGRVRVGACVEGEDVVLSVEDDGPGVPIPLRAAIFERFHRGDDSTTRRFGGTGLGLAIAKELVEGHGGRIEVRDGTVGGALFRVTLPLVHETGSAAPAARGMHDELARQTVAELRRREDPVATIRGSDHQGFVLVVEDNPEMNRFLVDCLAPDYRVATAFDGRQGLEKALELRPDLILTDVMMPVMGGDVLARELRAHPELEGTPIVVLTAKADDELRVKLLREGVQDFLTKPVLAEELRARVANLVMLKRTAAVLQGALSSQSHDLAALADELADANRAKDEFLAVLSHELRSPLNAILWWSFLLGERQLDEATRRAVEVIQRNAKVQAGMVADLLDVSRAITGKLRLDLRPMPLDPVVHAAIDSVRPAGDAKGIGLVAEIGTDPGLVSGDPARLQQVVWNLVSNAIKFTPRGGRVEVGLARAGDSLELSVRDNGVGIRPEFLPRMFERFWQADSSTTRRHGGLGIGLAVVRHLVELHGGTVRAESEGEGQGATFTVRLPVVSGAQSVMSVDETAAARLQGFKVLVVDDDQDTCEAVGAVLERAGAEVRTCLSASHALTAMDTWVPDILVCDIGMPGEDGYTLIRKVRARNAEEGGRVAAVALTAFGQNEDRLKALSAGFQLHVGKPIEPSQLVSVVASVTRLGTH